MTVKNDFITIKKAAELTDKANNTIRNLIQKNLHNDSKVIQIKKGKKNIYLINKNFLFESYNLVQKNQNESINNSKMNQNQNNESMSESKNTDEIVKILRQVIENQQKQINNLTEALREQQNLTRNEQTLMLANTQKPNFLQKLFGKKEKS